MEQQSSVETGAIKALAAASKTPFKTAFKATLGVAAAQLVVAFVFFGTLLGGCAALIHFVRH